MLTPLIVAVVGAECTGKTTLCAQVADQLGALWVPEALREFVDRHQRPPTAHEQHALLAEQIAREDDLLADAATVGAPLVLADSAPLATALYSRIYYDDATLLARALAHHQRYALTLATDTDLPWEADGLQRDGPAMRARFDADLSTTLERHMMAAHRVRGRGAARVAGALLALRDTLASR